MKRLLGTVFVLLCALCLLCANTAYAQLHSASIKGETQVLAGRAYAYSVTVDAKYNFLVYTKCSGVFEMIKNPACESPSGGSKTVIIEVSVKKDAKPGDIGTITIEGSCDVLDENNNPLTPLKIERTFTATVVAPAPEPTPVPATPAPPSALPSEPPPPTPQPSVTSASRKEQPLAPAPSVMPNAQELSDHIATLGDGQAATFPAARSANISLLALSALQQKQGIITLDFGTYTCTIDGALLGSLPSDMLPIDLSVSMLKDEALSHAAGGQDSYQLHFAHSGALPGVFGFGFPAVAHQPGDTLYLYYYYESSGIIEYKHSAIVDENGWVTFDIFHCSSYFVTDVPRDGMSAEPSSSRQINAVSEITEESAPLPQAFFASDTPPAVTLPALIGALLIAMGAGIFVTLKVSSRRQK